MFTNLQEGDEVIKVNILNKIKKENLTINFFKDK